MNDDKFKGNAFGTDCLLKALERDRVLDVAQCDAAYLKLMKWRYRFLVPSVEFLTRLAEKYKGNPPGNELIEIAAYVHDCMRDPGLFSGLEKTDPPIPMCGRLFTVWTDLVVRFVAHLWENTDFTCEIASALTKWSLGEFLPSPPRAFALRRRDMIDITERLLLEKLLGDLALLPDTGRAKTAVSCIREALYLSDEEFYRALCPFGSPAKSEFLSAAGDHGAGDQMVCGMACLASVSR